MAAAMLRSYGGPAKCTSAPAMVGGCGGGCDGGGGGVRSERVPAASPPATASKQVRLRAHAPISSPPSAPSPPPPPLPHLSATHFPLLKPIPVCCVRAPPAHSAARPAHCIPSQHPFTASLHSSRIPSQHRIPSQQQRRRSTLARRAQVHPHRNPPHPLSPHPPTHPTYPTRPSTPTRSTAPPLHRTPTPPHHHSAAPPLHRTPTPPHPIPPHPTPPHPTPPHLTPPHPRAMAARMRRRGRGGSVRLGPKGLRLPSNARHGHTHYGYTHYGYTHYGYTHETYTCHGYTCHGSSHRACTYSGPAALLARRPGGLAAARF
jgi:hypothetical protein